MTLSFATVTRIAACALVAIGATGCGTGSSRVALSGKVTFKGNPVEEGTIQFYPKDSSDGDATGAMVREGRYSIDAAHGVPPGNYVVRISAPNFKGKRPAFDAMPGAPYLAAELLPDKYNQKSTLTITVPPGAAQSIHDFILD